MFTWSGTKNLVLSRMGSCFSPLYRSMMTCRGSGEDRLVLVQPGNTLEKPHTGRTHNPIRAKMTLCVLSSHSRSRWADGHLIFCCGVLLGLLFHRQGSRWTDQASVCQGGNASNKLGSTPRPVRDEGDGRPTPTALARVRSKQTSEVDSRVSCWGAALGSVAHLRLSALRDRRTKQKHTLSSMRGARIPAHNKWVRPVCAARSKCPSPTSAASAPVVRTRGQ